MADDKTTLPSRSLRAAMNAAAPSVVLASPATALQRGLAQGAASSRPTIEALHSVTSGSAAPVSISLPPAAQRGAAGGGVTSPSFPPRAAPGAAGALGGLGDSFSSTSSGGGLLLALPGDDSGSTSSDSPALSGSGTCSTVRSGTHRYAPVLTGTHRY